MSNGTLLIVEDDLALREAVRGILELAGYQVLTAANGVEGLEVLSRAQPELIISDIMMSEMDGYQFFDAVRSNAAWLAVPFIFLTAKGEKSDVRLGKQLGADDYITKPFDQDDLLVAVVSRLKRQAQLRAVREAELGALKSAILTTLNHEFRTPLTYITAYADMLADSGPDLGPDEFHTLILGLKAGSARLTKLVEDFLLLVELLAGKGLTSHRQHRTPIEDWRGFLQSAIDPFQPKAQKRNVTLEVECAPHLPGVYADPDRLREALNRLIDNAIKFSKRSGGIVRVSAQAGEALRLTVSDNGIGIRPEELANLFDLFHQIDRAKMEQQGVGSGLAICRAIVDLHGGKISLESEVGEGTTFIIELPLERS